jgi:hypothetical protein
MHLGPGLSSISSICDVLRPLRLFGSTPPFCVPFLLIDNILRQKETAR